MNATKALKADRAAGLTNRPRGRGPPTAGHDGRPLAGQAGGGVLHTRALPLPRTGSSNRGACASRRLFAAYRTENQVLRRRTACDDREVKPQVRATCRQTEGTGWYPLGGPLVDWGQEVAGSNPASPTTSLSSSRQLPGTP